MKVQIDEISKREIDEISKKIRQDTSEIMLTVDSRTNAILNRQIQEMLEEMHTPKQELIGSNENIDIDEIFDSMSNPQCTSIDVEIAKKGSKKQRILEEIDISNEDQTGIFIDKKLMKILKSYTHVLKNFISNISPEVWSLLLEISLRLCIEIIKSKSSQNNKVDTNSKANTTEKKVEPLASIVKPIYDTKIVEQLSPAVSCLQKSNMLRS